MSAMKWISELGCWAFDDGRIAVPSKKTTLRFLDITARSGKKGYLHARINKKYVYIHRLIASAFIPNPTQKPVVDHIDRNVLNNSAENLRWATYSENGLNSQPHDECISVHGVGSRDPNYHHIHRELNIDKYRERDREYQRLHRAHKVEYNRERRRRLRASQLPCK